MATRERAWGLRTTAVVPDLLIAVALLLCVAVAVIVVLGRVDRDR